MRRTAVALVRGMEVALRAAVYAAHKIAESDLAQAVVATGKAVVNGTRHPGAAGLVSTQLRLTHEYDCRVSNNNSQV